MSYIALPIVGAHYRPPAKALLATMPVGTKLYLLAEPDNQFDPNAIAVFVETKDFPEENHASLEVEAGNYGFSLDTIMSQEAWHLGYIPKEFAAQLKAAETVVNDIPLDGKFATDPKGAPRFEFPEPVL